MDTDRLLSEDLSTLSDDEMIDAVVTFSAHMNAAEYQLIRLVDEIDRRDSSAILGTSTLPQWLGFRCGLDGNAAREKLRVARALRELPAIRACFEKGEVSYSKVRAITRVANEHNEGILLSCALGSTAAQMERLVRDYRHVERVEDPEAVLRQRRRRGLDWWFDEEGMLVIRGRLAPEDGALFVKAIEAVCTRMKEDERAAESDDLKVRMHGEVDEEAESPWCARRADALVEILEAGLGNVDGALPGGERTLVVMHVPVGEPVATDSALAPSASDESGCHGCAKPPRVPGRGSACEFEDGPIVPSAVARRVACDASVVTHHEHADGRVASIGRRSRTVPYWLRRALKHRDGGCRFPGCGRTRHVDAHHVVHWAEGGETSLENLVLLCRHHHRLIHEGRIHVRPDAAGDFAFDAADGRTIPKTFPQERGDAGALLRMNEARGLSIDADTGLIAKGYSPRPDFGVSVATLWRASHPEGWRCTDRTRIEGSRREREC